MNDAIRKADVLIEALSYIRTFRDKLTVIKLGGSAMEEPEALRATLQDVVFMETVGMRPILVHGGGKPIDRAMAQAGLVPRKVQGRRYTDDATLALVVRVLREEINAAIVRQIRELGGRAVGLHSGTLQCLFGERLTLPGPDGAAIDLGRVGHVTRVDCPLIQDFCAAGVVPVIPSLAIEAPSPLGGEGTAFAKASPSPPTPLPQGARGDTSVAPLPQGARGERWLNVNADTAAAAVAAQLRAEKLVVLTDTPGILLDRTDRNSLVSHLDAAGVRDLIQRGVIDEGMIPKVEACLESLRAGVKKTHMIDGRVRHSLLLEIYTDKGVGTEIVIGP
jgi:acetylglutamate kinase